MLEAELEAQTTENIRKARDEEKERFRRLEGERDTLSSCLTDISEMKRNLADRCRAQEGQLSELRERLAAAEAAASVVHQGPVLPRSP